MPIKGVELFDEAKLQPAAMSTLMPYTAWSIPPEASSEALRFASTICDARFKLQVIFISRFMRAVACAAKLGQQMNRLANASP
eukprot:2229716-Alexandrium_andersonii.AAC.1